MMALAVDWCDGDAVARVLGGDTDAFAPLVERYQQRVHRFIRHQVPRADVAEDLAQETFLQAYRALASFRADAKFSTWLLGIARNVVLNFVNRDWQPHDCGLEDGDHPDASLDPARLSQRDEALDQLQREIAALSAELRECLVLIALNGMEYAEACALLQVPPGTVKSRLNRARHTLKEKLGEDFFASMLGSDGTFR
jgi:RNA polymerase sigma-70 factor (ECF subfamily)